MHEIESLVQQIKIVEDKLNNKDFLSKAPEKIVNLEKQKIVDFKLKLEQELNKLKSTILSRLSEDEIIWFIQEIREYELNWQFDGWGKKEKSNILIYSQEWFNYVYNPIINPIEILNLSNYCKENKLSIVFSHNQYYSENIANFDHLPKLLPERSFDIYFCKSLVTGDNIFYSDLPNEEILSKKNIHYCCKLEKNKEYPNWFFDKVSDKLSEEYLYPNFTFDSITFRPYYWYKNFFIDIILKDNKVYGVFGNNQLIKLSQEFREHCSRNKHQKSFAFDWFESKLRNFKACYFTGTELSFKVNPIKWIDKQKKVIEIIFRNMLKQEIPNYPERLLEIYIQTQFKIVDKNIQRNKHIWIEQQTKGIPF